jgi:hypothetical protein
VATVFATVPIDRVAALPGTGAAYGAADGLL